MLISAVPITNNFTIDAYCLCLEEILAQFLIDIQKVNCSATSFVKIVAD